MCIILRSTRLNRAKSFKNQFQASNLRSSLNSDYNSWSCNNDLDQLVYSTWLCQDFVITSNFFVSNKKTTFQQQNTWLNVVQRISELLGSDIGQKVRFQKLLRGLQSSSNIQARKLLKHTYALSFPNKTLKHCFRLLQKSQGTLVRMFLSDQKTTNKKKERRKALQKSTQPTSRPKNANEEDHERILNPTFLLIQINLSQSARSCKERSKHHSCSQKLSPLKGL